DRSDHSINVQVRRLRRKLYNVGQDAPIITVRGVGYMLNTEVTRR
ncbi:helix-turn-helix domain-containing protein, partial [Clostridium perfringens]